MNLFLLHTGLAACNYEIPCLFYFLDYTGFLSASSANVLKLNLLETALPLLFLFYIVDYPYSGLKLLSWNETKDNQEDKIHCCYWQLFVFYALHAHPVFC